MRLALICDPFPHPVLPALTDSSKMHTQVTCFHPFWLAFFFFFFVVVFLFCLFFFFLLLFFVVVVINWSFFSISKIFRR